MTSQAEKVPCSAHFSLQDATTLPYGNRSFDFVLIGNALHMIPDPRKALSESYRVLKDGGIFLAPTFVYGGKVKRIRMRLTGLAGLRTFHKWDRKRLWEFAEGNRFRFISCELVPGGPLPAVFAVFRKT